ncbi:uncharacterized protein B0I36DRAFT_332366 [Microdochium trichocladiopsis]|uniref:Uncharacterized protein n=1 Tax=Microdochium trichocladiopsis TaxID=1682393 RepID=A0A9P8XY69_9PEZI|nr:uncharacterized protein B0I36DRAFT_332366 [Microdochium trichocladiopsis]KAH7024993.1 hypothetical protein B0I36DRAFT_332366 [Microdochium trichocladiopsis]
MEIPLQPALGTCAAHPYTFYDIAAYSTAGGTPCPPPNPYSTATSAVTYLGGGIDNSYACRYQCSSSCKAYVAYYTSYLYGPSQTVNSVNCFFYTSQLPAPTSCSAAAPYISLYASYYDDIRVCFRSSTAAASRYCSYLLNKPDPSTVVIYTTTSTGPPQTSTSTSVVTSTVCAPQKRALGGRVAQETGFPILTDVGYDKAAAAAAAPSPKPTPSPGKLPRRALGAPPACPPPQLEQRAPQAPPPACFDPVAYSDWTSVEACSCLLTDDITATTVSSASVTPGATTIVSATVTTTVQSSAVPTFEALVNVPARQQGVPPRVFPLISRRVTDADGNERRVLLFRRGPKKEPKDDRGVSMYVSPEGQLFTVSRELNYLRPFGQITLVTLQGGLVVLGQLPKGTAADSQNVLQDCVVPETGSVRCKLSDGLPAVFSVVRLPGDDRKHARAIAVGREAVAGARVVSLNVGARGTVIIGCGAEA